MFTVCTVLIVPLVDRFWFEVRTAEVTAVSIPVTTIAIIAAEIFGIAICLSLSCLKGEVLSINKLYCLYELHNYTSQTQM